MSSRVASIRLFRSWRGTCALLLAVTLAAGCDSNPKPPKVSQPYVDVGYKPNIPEYLRGTVYERTEVTQLAGYPVSGYSLCVNLQNTGDNSSIPTVVREMMIKKMALAGFGEHADPRFTNFQPEDVLRDKRVAVVEVIGLIPAGARRGQQFDVLVRAMPRSHTTSLAHGHMYQIELRTRGLEDPDSGGPIWAYADDGDVFVNPVYALASVDLPNQGMKNSEKIASLQIGTVFNSGRVTEDRPIILHLRVPQASIARAIESRVLNRYPTDDGDRPSASAEDEGLVYLYVPLSFNGDWRHFLGVVNHLYLSDSPDVEVQKANLLMAEAHKPHTADEMQDISYCLEGFGASGVSMYAPMIDDRNPACAYTAARAAVFCGDAHALEALIEMACDTENPYALAAVHTLGQLPDSSDIDTRLEPLLSSDQALLRIEAYKILAAHDDRLILTEPIEDHFKLDIVDCGGPPLIYATRTGDPHLVFFGRGSAITAPIAFAVMNDRLSISSDEDNKALTIFYRTPLQFKPIITQSGFSMAEVAARLGGKGPPGEEHFDFPYGDIVAIIQKLTDEHRIQQPDDSGQLADAAFVLEKPSELIDVVNAASLEARPQGGPAPVHVKERPSSPSANTTAMSAPSFAATSGSPTIAGSPAPSNAPPGGGTSQVPNFGDP
jgi:Flagellar P-ring protein